VKQGDSISATLFALFINNLAEEIKESGLGLNIGEDSETIVSILMYADDIVLLAPCENDMQDMLTIIELWCTRWRLEVNLSKTNVMHIRGKRSNRSRFCFIFNKRRVEYCETYKYLGVMMNEFMDYDLTASSQADTAGRALGSIIAKTIKNGGLPYNVITMLYDSFCASISDYGSEVWGFTEKDGQMKIHLRAIRTFLGVPKNNTSVALLAEMNWLDPTLRANLRMVRQYQRIQKMKSDRLPNIIFLWDKKDI